jgi:hypothetical protein
MAYINAEEVKAIRNALKKKFPEHKFSVTKDSGGLAVNVAIMEGPAFKAEDEEWSQYQDKYVAVDLNTGHHQINHVWCKDHYPNNGEFFEEIVKIIKTAPYEAGVGDLWFDESDAMIDYFHTAYYFHIEVGKWDKPFKVKEVV